MIYPKTYLLITMLISTNVLYGKIEKEHNIRQADRAAENAKKSAAAKASQVKHEARSNVNDTVDAAARAKHVAQ